MPGLPFTGTDTIIRTRSLEGGGSVVTSLTAKVVRDSQGRLYREDHHFRPRNTDPQTTLFAFTVLDPTAGTKTICIVASRSCTINNYRPRHLMPPDQAVLLRPAGPFDGGKQLLTRENLGSQSMENVDVVGTREITTITPGTVGNERTLTVTRVFWYSPELKTNISVTRADPREGTEVIRLAILSRSEPDPSNFAIPENYAIVDHRSDSTR